MSMTVDKVATLRAQTHGHESIVVYEEETYCVDAAIATGGNSTAQGKSWYKDISPTLKAGGGTRCSICGGVQGEGRMEIGRRGISRTGRTDIASGTGESCDI